METKSRYEVIADLEAKKREYILQKNSLEGNIKNREREIKMLKRQLEDAEEDLELARERLDGELSVLDDLIKGVDESLARMADISKSK